MPSYAITGANRGLGLELVKQLSAVPENTIYALVRNVEASKKSLTPYVERGNVHVFRLDLEDSASIRTAAKEIEKVTTSIDVLINNAGLIPDGENSALLGPGDENAEKKLVNNLETFFRINTTGPILTTNAFLPLIQKSTLKKVVVISSGVADVDFTLAANFPYSPEYAISKAGISIAYAKYAAQYKDEGVLFVSISPGLVNTSVTPPTPEELAMGEKLVGLFREAYPNFKGPISEYESASKVLKVIEDLSPATSGQFLSHYGNKQWL